MSLGLLGYLASKVGIAEARSVISQADAALIVAATMLLFAQPFLGALRWKVTARALGGSLSYEASLRYFWIGAFFNQAVPGSVGGDIVRMWLYAKQGAPRFLAVTSVALERVLMFLTLLILVLAVQPGLAARGAPSTIVIAAAFMLFLAVLGAGLLLVLARLFARHGVARSLRPVMRLSEATGVMLQDARRTAVVFTLCIAAYLNMAVTMWLLARGLALHVSVMDCMVFAPVVFLAGVLPISIGGWGVRESASVLVFALIGVSRPDALALSILFGLSSIAVSLPGAALWLRQGARQDDIDDVSAEVLIQQSDPLSPGGNRSDIAQSEANLPRHV